MANVSGNLATDGSTAAFMMRGVCDVWIIGLTSGSIQLQVKFSGEDWKDAPDGTFTGDTMKTLANTEDQVLYRLVGSGNNSDVYVRLAR